MLQQPGEQALIRLSLIISVLESYEIVRRQCSHLASIVPADCELILLDDGSNPPLPMPETRPGRFSLVYTRNAVPWTQPIARNLGARLARGRYLFFTDIDHIISREAIQAVYGFTKSRMMFRRTFAVLDESGQIILEREALRSSGWDEEQEQHILADAAVHQNTFAIRRDLFLQGMHGGYDESLCAGGRYGGDDVEFNRRYAGLVASRHADPDELGPTIFVYPDPASSDKFHRLSR